MKKLLPSEEILKKNKKREKIKNKPHNKAPFSTLAQAFEWTNQVKNTTPLSFPKEEKLQRITQALAYFDNPHHHFKAIHITGSKGKSSTAYACAHFFVAQEYRTGLFTSPHIRTYNERIKINQAPVEDDIFLSVLASIYHMTVQTHTSLTMFEILTLAACLIFKAQHVEYAFFEVGIGGRFDTTNFLSPVLCIITNIEREHTHILGDTIEEICYQKAGIIKPHTPVWIGAQTYPQVVSLLTQYAQEQQSPCHYIKDYAQIKDIHFSLHHNLNTHIKASLSLTSYETPHTHQVFPLESSTSSLKILENQVLADFASHHFLHIAPNQVSHIYQNTMQLPCRSELLTAHTPQLPHVFLDGAHTPHSIQAAFTSIEKIADKVVLLFALSKDKDYHKIASILSQYAHMITHLVVTQAGTFRKSYPQEVYHALLPHFPHISLEPQEDKGIHKAIQLATNSPHSPLLVILGSFYLCSAAREKWVQ